MQQEKQFWRRYIYLWINYAIWEELEAEDEERARDVYRVCLELIPHRHFTFAKVWLLHAQFEIRHKNLAAARKSLVSRKSSSFLYSPSGISRRCGANFLRHARIPTSIPNFAPHSVFSRTCGEIPTVRWNQVSRTKTVSFKSRDLSTENHESSHFLLSC